MSASFAAALLSAPIGSVIGICAAGLLMLPNMYQSELLNNAYVRDRLHIPAVDPTPWQFFLNGLPGLVGISIIGIEFILFFNLIVGVPANLIACRMLPKYRYSHSFFIVTLGTAVGALIWPQLDHVLNSTTLMIGAIYGGATASVMSVLYFRMRKPFDA